MQRSRANKAISLFRPGISILAGTPVQAGAGRNLNNYDIVRQPHKVKDGGGDSASKRTRTKTIIDPHGKFLQGGI
ncbi:hypothetical protein CFP56_023061 [Quercus suber]|uniref:Uncharacterized protein n=1 Tax=Quercus suber TaxID=58331 RepID=A0AAW0KAM5_QUESU